VTTLEPTTAPEFGPLQLADDPSDEDLDALLDPVERPKRSRDDEPEEEHHLLLITGPNPVLEAIWEGLLQESIWKEALHPRWPPHSHDAKGKYIGGEFMRIGQRFNLDGHEWEISHIADDKVIANEASGKVENAETRVFDTKHMYDSETGKHIEHALEGAVPAKPRILRSGKGSGEQHNTPVAPTATQPHDPSIPLNPNSELTPEEWAQFGRVDQLYYNALMDHFGKWQLSNGAAPGALSGTSYPWSAKLKQIYAQADKDFGSHDASGLVETAFGHQYGGSSGQTLSLTTVFKGILAGDAAGLANAQQRYAQGREVEGEVNALIAWDLFNRLHSPDVSVIHRAHGGEFFGDAIKGKIAIMSGLSNSWRAVKKKGQSDSLGTQFGTHSFVMSVPIRHVTLATDLVGGSYHGENEFSIADRLKVSPENAVYVTQKQMPDPQASPSKPPSPLYLWLYDHLNHNGGGGVVAKQLARHMDLSDPFEIDLPPADADFELKHKAGEKTYFIPPLDKMHEIEAAVSATPGTVPEDKQSPVTQLALKPGDIFSKGNPDLRYLVIQDDGLAATQPDRVRYIALNKGSGNDYDLPGEILYDTNQGRRVVDADGKPMHFDLPPKPREKGLAPYNMADFTPGGPQIKLSQMEVGDHIAINNDHWEVTGKAPGKVTIKSLTNGNEATVNSGWATNKLYPAGSAPPIEGPQPYVPAPLPTATPTPTAPMFEPKEGEEALSKDFGIVKVVDAADAATGTVIVETPTGMQMAHAVHDLSPAPTLPELEPQKGDTFTKDGFKYTIQNVQKNGIITARPFKPGEGTQKVEKFAPPKLDSGAPNPVWAGGEGVKALPDDLFRPDDYQHGEKAKLKDMEPGQLVSGSPSTKKPFLVLGQYGSKTYMKNLDTGEIIHPSANISYTKLNSKAETEAAYSTQVDAANAANDYLEPSLPWDEISELHSAAEDNFKNKDYPATWSDGTKWSQAYADAYVDKYGWGKADDGNLLAQAIKDAVKAQGAPTPTPTAAPAPTPGGWQPLQAGNVKIGDKIKSPLGSVWTVSGETGDVWDLAGENGGKSSVPKGYAASEDGWMHLPQTPPPALTAPYDLYSPEHIDQHDAAEDYLKGQNLTTGEIASVHVTANGYAKKGYPPGEAYQQAAIDKGYQPGVATGLKQAVEGQPAVAPTQKPIADVQIGEKFKFVGSTWTKTGPDDYINDEGQQGHHIAAGSAPDLQVEMVPTPAPEPVVSQDHSTTQFSKVGDPISFTDTAVGQFFSTPNGTVWQKNSDTEATKVKLPPGKNWGQSPVGTKGMPAGAIQVQPMAAGPSAAAPAAPTAVKLYDDSAHMAAYKWMTDKGMAPDDITEIAANAQSLHDAGLGWPEAYEQGMEPYSPTGFKGPQGIKQALVQHAQSWKEPTAPAAPSAPAGLGPATGEQLVTGHHFKIKKGASYGAEYQVVDHTPDAEGKIHVKTLKSGKDYQWLPTGKNVMITQVPEAAPAAPPPDSEIHSAGYKWMEDHGIDLTTADKAVTQAIKLHDEQGVDWPNAYEQAVGAVPDGSGLSPPTGWLGPNGIKNAIASVGEPTPTVDPDDLPIGAKFHDAGTNWTKIDTDDYVSDEGEHHSGIYFPEQVTPTDMPLPPKPHEQWEFGDQVKSNDLQVGDQVDIGDLGAHTVTGTVPGMDHVWQITDNATGATTVLGKNVSNTAQAPQITYLGPSAQAPSPAQLYKAHLDSYTAANEFLKGAGVSGGMQDYQIGGMHAAANKYFQQGYAPGDAYRKAADDAGFVPSVADDLKKAVDAAEPPPEPPSGQGAAPLDPGMKQNFDSLKIKDLPVGSIYATPLGAGGPGENYLAYKTTGPPDANGEVPIEGGWKANGDAVPSHIWTPPGAATPTPTPTPTPRAWTQTGEKANVSEAPIGTHMQWGNGDVYKKTGPDTIELVTPGPDTTSSPGHTLSIKGNVAGASVPVVVSGGEPTTEPTPTMPITPYSSYPHIADLKGGDWFQDRTGSKFHVENQITHYDDNGQVVGGSTIAVPEGGSSKDAIYIPHTFTGPDGTEHPTRIKQIEAPAKPKGMDGEELEPGDQVNLGAFGAHGYTYQGPDPDNPGKVLLTDNITGEESSQMPGALKKQVKPSTAIETPPSDDIFTAADGVMQGAVLPYAIDKIHHDAILGHAQGQSWPEAYKAAAIGHFGQDSPTGAQLGDELASAVQATRQPPTPTGALTSNEADDLLNQTLGDGEVHAFGGWTAQQVPGSWDAAENSYKYHLVSPQGTVHAAVSGPDAYALMTGQQAGVATLTPPPPPPAFTHDDVDAMLADAKPYGPAVSEGGYTFQWFPAAGHDAWDVVDPEGNTHPAMDREQVHVLLTGEAKPTPKLPMALTPEHEQAMQAADNYLKGEGLIEPEDQAAIHNDVIHTMGLSPNVNLGQAYEDSALKYGATQTSANGLKATVNQATGQKKLETMGDLEVGDKYNFGPGMPTHEVVGKGDGAYGPNTLQIKHGDDGTVSPASPDAKFSITPTLVGTAQTPTPARAPVVVQTPLSHPSEVKQPASELPVHSIAQYGGKLYKKDYIDGNWFELGTGNKHKYEKVKMAPVTVRTPSPDDVEPTGDTADLQTLPVGSVFALPGGTKFLVLANKDGVHGIALTDGYQGQPGKAIAYSTSHTQVPTFKLKDGAALPAATGPKMIAGDDLKVGDSINLPEGNYGGNPYKIDNLDPGIKGYVHAVSADGTMSTIVDKGKSYEHVGGPSTPAQTDATGTPLQAGDKVLHSGLGSQYVYAGPDPSDSSKGLIHVDGMPEYPTPAPLSSLSKMPPSGKEPDGIPTDVFDVAHGAMDGQFSPETIENIHQQALLYHDDQGFDWGSAYKTAISDELGYNSVGSTQIADKIAAGLAPTPETPTAPPPVNEAHAQAIRVADKWMKDHGVPDETINTVHYQAKGILGDNTDPSPAQVATAYENAAMNKEGIDHAYELGDSITVAQLTAPPPDTAAQDNAHASAQIKAAQWLASKGANPEQIAAVHDTAAKIKQPQYSWGQVYEAAAPTHVHLTGKAAPGELQDAIDGPGHADSNGEHLKQGDVVNWSSTFGGSIQGVYDGASADDPTKAHVVGVGLHDGSTYNVDPTVLTKDATESPVTLPSADTLPQGTPPTVPDTGSKIPDSWAELSSYKKISGPKGAKSGQWYEAPDGTRLYVKPDDDAHAYNEVGGLAAYQAAGFTPGVDFPHVAVMHDNYGQAYIVSQAIPGTTVPKSASWWAQHPEAKKNAEKMFGVHALISHYDAVGANPQGGYDNLLVGEHNNPVVIEAGGGMAYSGLGSPKPTWKPSSSLLDEVRGVSGTGVIPNPTMKTVYGDLSDSRIAELLNETHQNLDPAKLESLWKQQGMPQAQIDQNIAVIQSRLDQIPSIVGSLSPPKPLPKIKPPAPAKPTTAKIKPTGAIPDIADLPVTPFLGHKDGSGTLHPKTTLLQPGESFKDKDGRLGTVVSNGPEGLVAMMANPDDPGGPQKQITIAHNFMHKGNVRPTRVVKV